MSDDPLLPYSLRRNTDPDTSHESAVAIMPHLSKLQAWAIQCVETWPGRTCVELARIVAPDDQRRLGRRLGECEKMGMIRCGDKRPCKVTRRNAMTWWPADKGAT